jgi:hypothetical protein
MKVCLITTAAVRAAHKKYQDEYCSLTMTWAAKESPIMTPIHRTTAVEN